mgnify:CR=1 FL=1
MERTTAASRRYRRQTYPKRVIWLKLLCVFAALALAALLVCSPAQNDPRQGQRAFGGREGSRAD